MVRGVAKRKKADRDMLTEGGRGKGIEKDSAVRSCRVLFFF